MAIPKKEPKKRTFCEKAQRLDRRLRLPGWKGRKLRRLARQSMEPVIREATDNRMYYAPWGKEFVDMLIREKKRALGEEAKAVGKAVKAIKKGRGLPLLRKKKK